MNNIGELFVLIMDPVILQVLMCYYRQHLCNQKLLTTLLLKNSFGDFYTSNDGWADFSNVL
jgi:hypothetical protein